MQEYRATYFHYISRVELMNWNRFLLSQPPTSRLCDNKKQTICLIEQVEKLNGSTVLSL